MGRCNCLGSVTDIPCICDERGVPQTKRPPMTDTATLVSRLRRTKPSHHKRQPLVGRAPVNPDGPKAADTIEAQAAEIAELKKQRLMVLAAVYGEAPKFVATICDTKLDRSGALLGEVRELARAALKDTHS